MRIVTIVAALVAAASLEIVSDALIRRGLVQSTSVLIFVGFVLLAGYGLLVNVDRTIEFGRLMGLYITIFFVVSQIVSFAFFGETPSIPVLAGGALIVAGGLVMLLFGSM